MSTARQFPYDTRLKRPARSPGSNRHQFTRRECAPQVVQPDLCKLNASVVRLGVIEGEYHWHKHDEDDEFFYVV